jgi:hypothetical protein
MTTASTAGSPAAVWTDRLGLSLALLCALHCIATAVVLLSFPALWLQLRYAAPDYAWLLYAERWIAGASLSLAALALLLAWRRLRSNLARAALLTGAAGVVAGLWWPALAHSFWSIPAVSGGALLIAFGHFVHLRGWRRCR